MYIRIYRRLQTSYQGGRFVRLCQLGRRVRLRRSIAKCHLPHLIYFSALSLFYGTGWIHSFGVLMS